MSNCHEVPELEFSYMTGEGRNGKWYRQEEKGATEDELVGWHHRLDGHESEQAPGVADGQGGLACCDSWGHRVGYN